ncbi:ABC transporter permease [Nesterenkonia xinjiangensis]|uniref:ABC-type spermidine/putrescine transport system permease subunit I n=1 Tax=Nesterenkonia xinjiangensis TaxID=225327 RepID=A0A7Z0GN73_9MICC|nr:ABC transporter permease [Nesterenkonia xinjiangensis]NYJ78196.1 ABC-type spermidine/putrescine transport system permease subunit I [Nesterenkonia xinjiangensis]
MRRSPELWLILPVFLFMIVFYFYPLISLLSLSFEGPEGFTLSHYATLFQTDLYLRVFLRSIEVSLWVTLFSLLIGYPFAYYAVYSKVKLLLFGVVLISMWLGIIIRSYGWMGVLGDGGLVNYILGLLGRQETSTWLYNEQAVVIGMVHILMPYMILPVYAVMRSIPDNVLKASRSLGASNRYTFFKVYAPLTLPGVLAGSLLVFIQSIGFYITPALIGGRNEVMIAQLMEVQVNDLLNWPFASALATALLIVTVVALLVTSRVVPLKLLWGGR